MGMGGGTGEGATSSEVKTPEEEMKPVNDLCDLLARDIERRCNEHPRGRLWYVERKEPGLERYGTPKGAKPQEVHIWAGQYTKLGIHFYINPSEDGKHITASPFDSDPIVYCGDRMNVYPLLETIKDMGEFYGQIQSLFHRISSGTVQDGAISQKWRIDAKKFMWTMHESPLVKEFLEGILQLPKPKK